jgi:dienelactone hydrolase
VHPEELTLSPPPPTRTARLITSRRPRLIASLVLALGLIGGSIAVGAQTANAQGPYERGPAPTQAVLNAATGPFATGQLDVVGQSGFGGGKIYYPTDTSQGTFGAVAIVPGFLTTWDSMAWLGPRLASNGFVVIGINTNGLFDDPISRAGQVEKALDYVVADTRVNSRIDRTRLAVAGWSMGGGGALQAGLDRPTLKAIIPIAPVHFTITNFAALKVPTAIIAGQNDAIAPPATYSIPQYNSIPAATEKAYLELAGESHFFTNSVNNRQASLMVSWLKRWVDQDTRYTQFLCPGPSGSDISSYQQTCPY